MLHAVLPGAVQHWPAIRDNKWSWEGLQEKLHGKQASLCCDLHLVENVMICRNMPKVNPWPQDRHAYLMLKSMGDMS